MASLFDNVVQNFGAIPQLFNAQQQAKGAAIQSNTVQTQANKAGVGGYQFPSANAQAASQTGFTGPGVTGIAPIPTTGTSQPTKPMGTNATSPAANVTPKTNSLPSGFAVPGQTYAAYEASQGYPQSGNTSGGGVTGPNGTNTVPVPTTDGANTYSGGTNVNGQTLPGYGQQNGQSTSPYSSTSPTYPGLIGALATTAQGPTQAFTDAQNQYNQANQQLKDLQTQEAQQNANIGGSRTNLAEAGGEQGLLQNLYGTQASALTGEMTAAQAAAQNATTQQGTQQSGLAAAGAEAAPQNANALGTYNPATGQYSQYGGGTGGGAATAGAVGTQMEQGATVQTMTGNQAQAQSLTQNLTNLLKQNNINPTMPGGISALQGVASGIQQWIDTQTGDPHYQNYANLINEISQKYATILNSSGGTPTDQSQLSHQIINALASGQDLQTVIQQLDQNATGSIDALKKASGSNAVSGGQTNTGTTAGGFDYVQNAQGQWVPK